MPMRENYAHVVKLCPCGKAMPMRENYAHAGKLCPCGKTMPMPENYARVGQGISTIIMPAARAESMPAGASSKARHLEGEIPRRRAASRYMSGAGFPFETSSAVMTSSNQSDTPTICRVFSITNREPPVAMPMGTLPRMLRAKSATSSISSQACSLRKNASRFVRATRAGSSLSPYSALRSMTMSLVGRPPIA